MENNKRIIDFIKTTADEYEFSPHIERISHDMAISKRQLYREFEQYTGHSVSEFFRRRKLSRALALIKYSDFSLAETAAECGYSSQQAMNRDIKSLTGMTPLQYKNSNIIHYAAPYVFDSLEKTVVTKISLPALYSFQYHTTESIEIEDAALCAFYKDNSHYEGRIFGRSINNFRCYELYVEVEKMNNLDLTAFSCGKIIPESKRQYVCLTVPYNKKRIHEAWDYLYGTWLHTSMFAFSGEPYFEEFIYKNKQPWKIQLYLPVIKKDEYIRITINDQPPMRFICTCDTNEITASNRLMNFLKERYPSLLKDVRNFYIESSSNMYVCGIELPDRIDFLEADNIFEKILEKDRYVILHGCFDCDHTHISEFFQNWINENGFVGEKIFGLYNVDNGYHAASMKLYCKIKSGRI